jgi:hypothetical protein
LSDTGVMLSNLLIVFVVLYVVAYICKDGQLLLLSNNYTTLSLQCRNTNHILQESYVEKETPTESRISTNFAGHWQF